MARLIDCFGSGTATTLSMLARGEDTDPVKNRALPKAIGCGKNLQWVERSMGGVQKWLEQLSAGGAQVKRPTRVDNSAEALLDLPVWPGDKCQFTEMGILG